MIAVTAATGQLGRLTIDALLDRHVPAKQIVAAVRTPSKADDLASRGIEVREADYTKPETLASAFDGVEVVLLISGSEVGSRVPQHANVINAAKAAGVKHFVYTSAPHADTTTLILAPEHKATEALIAESGLNASILRNGWYSENYLPTLETARQSGTVLNSAGAGRVASAARSDYAEAAAAVLATAAQDPSVAGRIYEVTGDVAWNYDDLAATIGKVIGREVVNQSVSADEHRSLLTQAGLPAAAIDFVVGLDGNTAEGTLGEVNGVLAGLIGHPSTPIEETLRAGA